jgi:signal transduction histidine kinase
MRQDGCVFTEFRHRLRLWWWAMTSVPLALVSLVLFVVVVAGAGLIVVWIGVPILVTTIGATRQLADHRRRVSGILLGRKIEPPYLRWPTGSPVARIGRLAMDPAVRRDMVWLLVDGTVGLTLAIVGVVEGLLDLLFWWLPPGVALRVHARIDCALLEQSEKSRLAQRVEQLTESRTETVDSQAAELRRIERDLHDGAQARLVSLGMSLAMAEDQLERDPQGARELLSEARAASSVALAELRDLVRGIHPPVLADRGLVGAVQSLALAAPIPITVRTDLNRRLPAPVESAAYFAVAEALTNIVKHSGATAASVELIDGASTITATIVDDGRGGADPAAGTGLRGIERRLSAFDGTLRLESPRGGPTRLVIVLPCASSSPKTSPSSGTA